MRVRVTEPQTVTEFRVSSSVVGQSGMALNHGNLSDRRHRCGRNGVNAEVQYFVHGSGTKDTNSQRSWKTCG